MRYFIPKKQNLEETFTDYKIKDYLNKYLKELQRHFNITDKKMKKLLLDVYHDLKPFSFVKKILYAKMQVTKFLSEKREIKWK